MEEIKKEVAETSTKNSAKKLVKFSVELDSRQFSKNLEYILRANDSLAPKKVQKHLEHYCNHYSNNLMVLILRTIEEWLNRDYKPNPDFESACGESNILGIVMGETQCGALQYNSGKILALGKTPRQGLDLETLSPKDLLIFIEGLKNIYGENSDEWFSLKRKIKDSLEDLKKNPKKIETKEKLNDNPIPSSVEGLKIKKAWKKNPSNSIILNTVEILDNFIKNQGGLKLSLLSSRRRGLLNSFVETKNFYITKEGILVKESSDLFKTETDLLKSTVTLAREVILSFKEAVEDCPLSKDILSLLNLK